MTYTAFRDSLLSDPDFPAMPKRFTTGGLRAKLVEFAVREWSDPPSDADAMDGFRRDWIRRIKARCKATMSPLLLVVLMAALSSIVSWLVTRLLNWWMQDRLSRGPLLWKFRADLEHNA